MLCVKPENQLWMKSVSKVPYLDLLEILQNQFAKVPLAYHVRALTAHDEILEARLHGQHALSAQAC